MSKMLFTKITALTFETIELGDLVTKRLYTHVTIPFSGLNYLDNN